MTGKTLFCMELCALFGSMPCNSKDIKYMFLQSLSGIGCGSNCGCASLRAAVRLCPEIRKASTLRHSRHGARGGFAAPVVAAADEWEPRAPVGRPTRCEAKRKTIQSARAQAWRSRFAAPVTAAAAEWSPRADGLPDTTATPPRRARAAPAPQAAPYARTPTQLRPGHKGPGFAERMAPSHKYQPAAADSQSDGSGASLPRGAAAGFGSGFDGGARSMSMPTREAEAADPAAAAEAAALVSAGLEGGELSDAPAAAAGDGAVAPRGDADAGLDVLESDIEDDGARRWAAAQRHARLVRSPCLDLRALRVRELDFPDMPCANLQCRFIPWLGVLACTLGH